jgi:hypothetical protein
MIQLFAAGAVVAAVMAASAGARADYRDGNRLYADCTSPDTQLFCIGYVMAIADAARAPNAVGAAGFTVCGLEDVTVLNVTSLLLWRPRVVRPADARQTDLFDGQGRGIADRCENESDLGTTCAALTEGQGA